MGRPARCLANTHGVSRGRPGPAVRRPVNAAERPKSKTGSTRGPGNACGRGFTAPWAGSGDLVTDIGNGLVVERQRCGPAPGLMAFEVHGGIVVDGRVPPMRVVPTLDVVEELEASLGVGMETAAVDQLTLEGGEEALTQGVGLDCRMHPMRTQSLDISG